MRRLDEHRELASGDVQRNVAEAALTREDKALAWEIRHIVAADNVVLTERVDIFQIGDTRIRVPCMGVFELCAGQIVAWRDYWERTQMRLR